jgi:hypothetical protein
MISRATILSIRSATDDEAIHIQMSTGESITVDQIIGVIDGSHAVVSVLDRPNERVYLSLSHVASIRVVESYGAADGAETLFD